jgi:proline iminopeptidase
MSHRLIPAALLLLSWGARPLSAAEAQTPPSPAAPQAAIAAFQRDDLAGGIADEKFVPIGGIEQWISVKGRHKDAPLMLFLHGGPGLSTIPTSWYFLSPWEEYFTVAQWDQRGAGKTFKANPPRAAAPPLTVARMVTDAEEVIGYLRRTYGRRKIVLVGYSWGSVVGLQLAQRHPDWFFVYVGMGQFIQFTESEKRGHLETLADARLADDKEAVAALEAMTPYPDPNPTRALPTFFGERRWLAKYRGMVWNGDAGRLHILDTLSPDYDAADLAAADQGIAYSFPPLWPELTQVDFLKNNRFEIPVVFIDGTHDRNTSAHLLGDWCQTVHAPSKKLVWFSNSADFPYQEEPGKMLVTLVNDVLPLATMGSR